MKFLNCLVDIFLSSVTLIHGVLAFPFSLLRICWVNSKFAFSLATLLEEKQLANYLQSRLEWLMGDRTTAIALLDHVVSTLEEAWGSDEISIRQHHALSSCFTILTRYYLFMGRIDEAMVVVLRIKKSLDADALHGVGNLDAKTANLVRAGIAAGRLLEDGGITSMLFKSDSEADKNRKSFLKTKSSPLGIGSKKDGASKLISRGKVIPFPVERLSLKRLTEHPLQ